MKMNFNKLYTAFIESLNVYDLIAFDGKREIYVTSITCERFEHIHCTPIYRLPVDCIPEWDEALGGDWTVEKYNTFDQALMGSFDLTLRYARPTADDSFHPEALKVIDKLKEMFEPYKDLPGEWGFTNNVENDILYFGIEVDAGHIRKNQVANDLQNVDTTGLEDLL